MFRTWYCCFVLTALVVFAATEDLFQFPLQPGDEIKVEGKMVKKSDKYPTMNVFMSTADKDKLLKVQIRPGSLMVNTQVDRQWGKETKINTPKARKNGEIKFTIKCEENEFSFIYGGKKLNETFPYRYDLNLSSSLGFYDATGAMIEIIDYSVTRVSATETEVELESTTCEVGQKSCYIYFDVVSDDTETNEHIEICKVKKGKIAGCNPAVYDETSGKYRKWFGAVTASKAKYALFVNGVEGEAVNLHIKDPEN